MLTGMAVASNVDNLTVSLTKLTHRKAFSLFPTIVALVVVPLLRVCVYQTQPN